MPKIKNIVRLKNFYVSCERIVDKRNLKKAFAADAIKTASKKKKKLKQIIDDLTLIK